MSALPKLYSPEEEGLTVEELKAAVEDGRACIECHGEWEKPHPKPPVICTTCANAYLVQLLETLGYALRRDRGKNSEAWAERARQRRATE